MFPKQQNCSFSHGKVISVAVAVLLVAVTGCRGTSDRAERLVGKWHHTARGTVYTACAIELAKTGKSFVVKDLSTGGYGTCDVSKQFVGIYTATREGNLVNGPIVLMLDEETGQMVCSYGGGLTYFVRES